MEKINTPLMHSIERKQRRIEQLRDEYNDHDMQFPKPVYRMQQVLARIGELTMMIVDEKKDLPTEREVIENAYNEGKDTGDRGFGDNGSDYFTQTFKSYE